MPDLTDRFLEGNGSGYIEAGLPNIEGNLIPSNNSSIPWSAGELIGTGALYGESGNCNSANVGGYNGTYNKKILFDASRSSSIYGNSSTVQPSTCKCYFIIKY